MRRRPGIAGLQRDAQAREVFKARGEEVRQVTLAEMKGQMALFQSKLEEFAQKYKQDIRRDPAFRAQFHTMCANIGVDPLASNKGMWAELLGFGDFYYELGVQVLEAAWASRPLNGGLVELSALRRAVVKRRGARADPVSDDDIVRALKKLKALGGGLDLVTIGCATYVRTVPGELNMDKNKALEVAQASSSASFDPAAAAGANSGGFRGVLSAAHLRAHTGWDARRANECLQALLREGLAMLDDHAPGGEELYWFPCLAAGQER